MILAACLLAAGPFSTRAESLSTEAQRAFMAGDYETAKTKFKIILDQDPANRVAANYMRMIANAEAKSSAGAALGKQLEKISVPVEFKDTTLESALNRLREQVGTATGGKLQPNFVIAPGVNRLTPLTLRMTNAPVSEVLKYIGQLANLKVTVDAYAVTLKPFSVPDPAAR